MLTVACIMFCFAAHGQGTPDYDRVVPPAGTRTKTFPDYLVQRAWQAQGNTRALTAQQAIADLEIGRQRLAWLDHINGNINFSSQQDSVFGRFGGGDPRNPVNGELNDPIFLRPGFNYGVSFNFGGLILNKRTVRIAEQKRVIADARVDQEKLLVRAEVIARLEGYDNSREILRIRRQAEIDAETNYRLVQSLVERGKAQFEDLAQASEVYHRSVEATAEAESNVRLRQYALEEMTGEPWAESQTVRERMEVRN